MIAKKQLSFSRWEVLTSISLAAAIAALPHLTMWLIELTDSHKDAMGADIGGGLLSMISPIALTFFLGMAKPMAQRIWIAGAVLSMLFGLLFDLGLLDLSLGELISLIPFGGIIAALIAGAGVWGSYIGRLLRD